MFLSEPSCFIFFETMTMITRSCFVFGQKLVTKQRRRKDLEDKDKEDFDIIGAQVETFIAYVRKQWKLQQNIGDSTVNCCCLGSWIHPLYYRQWWKGEVVSSMQQQHGLDKYSPNKDYTLAIVFYLIKGTQSPFVSPNTMATAYGPA